MGKVEFTGGAAEGRLEARLSLHGVGERNSDGKFRFPVGLKVERSESASGPA
jgi:hypothetical protein